MGLQQFERRADDVVGLFAAQELDAELIENEKLLGLFEIADGGEAEDAGIGERLFDVAADGGVADDVGGVGFFRQRVDGGRIGREMKFEFVGADADVVPFVEDGFVGFLAVHKCAVAAAGVANDPTAVFVEDDLRVDARAEWIAEHDFAMIAATEMRGAIAVEEKILAGATSDGHCEIGVFLASCYRHGVGGLACG